MAAEVNGGGNVEVFPWLKSMPVAPEYHPSLAEFQDPIAYIFKIEKEASKYGICKIVPPVSAAPRKTVVANFNKSLLSRSTDAESGPVFTTRQQQIGFCPRKYRPVQKPVWQSGERYTLAEFESKAKNFERNYLKKYGKKGFSALEIETLYWNAMVDKPFSVEYANDMPGSAFVAAHKSGVRKNESSMTVGDTEWNMRRVSRGNLSLLRFMKEEIPGVTSPMVYVAMMFSWFAWHVEDHDLHSMNYLHMGAGKTWYGVPREAAVAFEEVIRVHGYGGEINPIVTFSMLGAKTTVMSPEVLLSDGVPCCRLVQNAGEFVVTFPRAYHSGFSHGFNCGEAANIATPEWLRVAKEAAIRRAAINCPPMVSHFQLLYDLALSLCSRVPKNIATEPRSSRLKDRKKGEGDMLIKELFFQDMMQNNDMLRTLGKGSPVLLLPENSLSRSICSDKQSMKQARGYYDTHTRAFSSFLCNSSFLPSESKKASEREQGLFSCVTCGILCFACVAIVQPTEEAARYIRSADSSVLNCFGVGDNDQNHIRDANAPRTYLRSESVLSTTHDELFDVPVSSDQLPSADEASLGKELSSLGLLALAYGISSDDEAEADIPVRGCRTIEVDDSPENGQAHDRTDLQVSDPDSKCEDGEPRYIQLRTNTCKVIESNSVTRSSRHQTKSRNDTSNSLISTSSTQLDDTMLFSSRSDEDSSRLHVFCLQHAMEVENRLSRVGGARMFLACHPDYLELDCEAKKVAEELGSDHHVWNEISFRAATEKDEEIIRLALRSENEMHGNGDWAVKLGVNLFYSANLSRSPLYCKQMHYNFVVYSAFGRSLPNDSSSSKAEVEVNARQKKIVVAGKWCGKVWMSSQAHPLLLDKDLRAQVHESEIATDSKCERRSEVGQVASTRTRRKGKIRNVVRRVTREKSVEAEKMDDDGPSLVFSLANFHNNQIKRKRGSRRWKKETPPAENSSDESSDDNDSRKQIKQLKKETRKQTTSEPESGTDPSEEFPNCWKQIKSKPEPIKNRQRNKKQPNSLVGDDDLDGGPSTRLRRRIKKPCKESGPVPDKPRPVVLKKKQINDATSKKVGSVKNCNKSKIRDGEEPSSEYGCDMEGCAMSFGSKQELALHKKNVCPVKGCGKKFFSHKYLVQHRRVHVDDRPLKCPWKGCKMTFKWAWARTEHIRVHTGARPYVCTEDGCGQTFRFVSDYSRHKRKTGHSPKKPRG